MCLEKLRHNFLYKQPLPYKPVFPLWRKFPEILEILGKAGDHMNSQIPYNPFNWPSHSQANELTF